MFQLAFVKTSSNLDQIW